MMSKRGAKSKPWHQHPVPAACLSLTILFLVYLVWDNDSIGMPMQKWHDFSSLNLRPTTEFRNGTDIRWQIPESPKAILFLAHGCDGRAANFWDRSLSCPDCVGLPEERLLVLHALARKFAVLTISSAGRCWTVGEERLIVKDIIQWWAHKNGLENLPLVALGASSGGHFVSALATNLKFSSVAIMIAEGVFDQMDITENYPPTLFVHMPKDFRRKQKISKFIEVLKNKGIDVAEVECMELPLSPSFLADRIPRLDQTTSAKLFELFQEKGYIDRNGYMKKDGRATRWKGSLLENNNISLDKNLYQHVEEELNLAYAYHEMTSLQSELIFKWFESHMK